MLSAFRLSFSFLTRFPLPSPKSFENADFPKSFIFFPLVGAVVGALLSSFAFLLLHAGAGEMLTSFLLLTALVLITGGIHIDGVADSVDGFFGADNRGERLRIMKEPAVGSFGMTAIALLLIGKFAGFYMVLESGAVQPIIVAMVLSRWGMAAVGFRAVYPRADGTGKLFIGKLSPESFAASSAIAFFFVYLLLGNIAAVYILLAAVLVLLVRKLSERKIGGITGDLLGATNELLELSLLITLGFL